MRKILEACPTCGGPLTITEVRCNDCDTEVRSQYQPCPFCRLSPEQMNFVLLFVQNRGNLSEMEKVLGISYPTIRGKLDEVIKAVSAAPPPVGSPIPTLPPEPESGRTSIGGRRREILDQVASGKLSAADALAALRGGERGDKSDG